MTNGKYSLLICILLATALGAGRCAGSPAPSALRITVDERSLAGGMEMGVVRFRQGKRSTVALKVQTWAGGRSPWERASEVAKRIRVAASADSLWWTTLRVEQLGASWAITCPTVPGGTLLTADLQAAGFWGVTAQDYAVRIAAGLRRAAAGPLPAASRASGRRAARSVASRRQSPPSMLEAAFKAGKPVISPEGLDVRPAPAPAVAGPTKPGPMAR